MPALKVKAEALGQQAIRLRQWRAASWAKAPPMARHRFLADVHRAEAGAHQLAAAGFAVAATPAGRADPQLRTTLTGLQRILAALAQLDARGPVVRPVPGVKAPPGPRPNPATPRPPTMPGPGAIARPGAASPRPIDVARPNGAVRPNGAAPMVGPDELASLRQAATEAIARLRQGMSAESEADHAMDPTSKRARANKQEAIRVDRTRTARAQQRVKGAEDRSRARQAAIALIRNRTPAIFNNAIMPIVIPNGNVTPEIVRKLASLAGGNFVQQIVSLVGSSDGGGSLDSTIVSATIASAVASAATELGIVDQVNTAAIAKAVNGVVASELSPALKILATVAVLATGRKSGGKRQAELAP
jgi:hypothetical protein